MLTAAQSAPAAGPRSRRRRLRVLHVGKYYPPVRGGMETHLQALCTGLSEYVDVRVLVAGTQRRTTVERTGRVTVTRSGSLGALAGTPVCPSMWRAIRASDADIVHLHHPNPTAALAYLASGHRGPLVVTYHSDIVRQRLLGAMIAPLVHRLLARASAIVFTSPNYLESSPMLRRHASRCHLLPFAVPTGDAGPVDREAVAAIRRRYGAPLVLGVGRQVRYKGFEHLVTAMRHVAGSLLLVGDGPERGRLIRLAAQHGISGRVHFLGEIDDLAPYYEAADLFVLPSVGRNEAFGLVQLEAMARGTPVVNTALDSGVPYVSLHGVTGLTVPPADPLALAGAIATLLDDPERRARYGAAARRRVADTFSVRAMVQRTAALYDHVAALAG
jgi:glycosyltransferase involved in cell wall biosynthesis